MRILYYACHEILEYDEVRLFRSLGHQVFSLGAMFYQQFKLRPGLPQDDKRGALMSLFHQEGCCRGATYHSSSVTRKFVEQFDIVIVMSESGFIMGNWEALKARPVVWRSVGMGVEEQEYLLDRYRTEGLKIVRYSPAERRNKAYLGEDALIRFYVDPDKQWSGKDKQVLTFSNNFVKRYPEEHQFFAAATEGFSCKIGGAFNESLINSIGAVPYHEQNTLYRESRTYFYCHGLHIPYTLNFIEAWSYGIPVVAIDPRSEEISRNLDYSEIGDFIFHGETGFLVKDPHEARSVLQQLLDDHAYASAIGAAGKQAAGSLFGVEKVRSQWDAFLKLIII